MSTVRRRRRGLDPETVRLEQQIQTINRFPDQNPNPVMRMTDDGLLTYANDASAPVVAALGGTVGESLPAPVLDRLQTALQDPDRSSIEVTAPDWRVFAVLPVAVPEFGFVNLYGTDVTAAKVVERFPGSNPNPVIRVSEDGVLVYANAASEPIRRAVGGEVGQPLPPDFVAKVMALLDAQGEPLEVSSEGLTFRLTPVRIPEFGFINVYGTDITALKALDKFPDQNPNPVMRVSRDGQLLYANPASAPIRQAFGVAVGDTVPPALYRHIEEQLEPGAPGVFEIETPAGLFSVKVASIYEFGFTNLYGTDITAARAIEEANRENLQLLLNILPEPIAARLRAGERVIADRFDDVTLLFADIVGFTQLSSTMSAGEVVDVLNRIFSLFDGLLDRYGLEKIKTIGDSYMVAGGLPERSEDHAERVALMALDLAAIVEELDSPYAITVRIGMHCGPVVAGVIGERKFIYDVWGDTVNVASRMESHGVVGRIQVTHAVRERLADTFAFEERGVIDVRGKGPMPTWFLVGPRAERSPAAEGAAGRRV